MSIAAFYRTELAFIQSWTYYDDKGRVQTVWTGIEYTKANVQPWKQGATTVMAAPSDYFADYGVVYIRNMPVYTAPEIGGIHEGTEITINGEYVWLDNQWYSIIGKQNWQRPGRGPKHWKLLINYTQTPNDDKPPTPNTSLRTVEGLENETYELEQAVKLFD